MDDMDGWMVYMLRCCDGSLYTGVTNDIERRLSDHREGRGSKYVRSRLPFMLVYRESAASQSDALKREAEIKKMPRCKKQMLAQNGPQ